MRIEELYRDYHVDYITEGNKHARDGWVNVHCPFCMGEPNYHLGFNTDGNYFNCWRCGKKGTIMAISKIIGVPPKKANRIIKDYGGIPLRNRNAEEKVTVSLRPIQYPSNIDFGPRHRAYLRDRNFRVKYLTDFWGITGTGPFSKLDGINYSNRIIAPIHWNGKLVSWQSRDIIGRTKLKYMACPQARERIEHQTILYGKQTEWKPRGICVEGITDVWRFGKYSFATFGIDFTDEQFIQIWNSFDEVAIAFDPDPQAQVQAEKLMNRLIPKGVKAWMIPLECDPADMTQDDADYLVKDIMGPWF